MVCPKKSDGDTSVQRKPSGLGLAPLGISDSAISSSTLRTAIWEGGASAKVLVQVQRLLLCMDTEATISS